jgi:hypothetical protein
MFDIVISFFILTNFLVNTLHGDELTHFTHIVNLFKPFSYLVFCKQSWEDAITAKGIFGTVTQHDNFIRRLYVHYILRLSDHCYMCKTVRYTMYNYIYFRTIFFFLLTSHYLNII